MPIPQFTFRIVLVLAICLFAYSSANAGSLYGTVTEINDGDTVTIVCLKRPLRVRLMGIDAPDKDQAYADVAKQHLSDLILDKFVGVEYSGLGSNSLIIGKVFLKDMDVGAQMIRDGVAWFDKNYDTSLNETDRQVYVASELAARSEQRGIWHDENPLPPWEFTEAKRLGQLGKSGPKVSVGVKRTTNSVLTSESLLQSFVGADKSLSSSKDSSDPTADKPDSQWLRLNPPGTSFSILVPGPGAQRSAKLPMGDGREGEIHFYRGRSGKTAYAVVSSTAAARAESDSGAMNGAINGFVTGIESDFAKLGMTFSCQATLVRELSVSGFLERQFDLNGCNIPGKVRLYTRVNDGVRELYLNAAFFFGSTADPNVPRFFNSFLATGPKSRGN